MTHTPPICPHDLGPGVSVCLRCLRDERVAARARLRRVASISVAIAIAAVAALVGVTVVSRTGWTDAKKEAAKASPPPPTTSAVEMPLSRPPFAPIIAEGLTALRDGVVAERAGDTVTVRFDSMGERTRRPEKFEALLRSTLPSIYGDAVRSALATLPHGSVASAGDLVSELPRRGLTIPIREGWTLRIVPGTRSGDDGPLVISYRTTLER